MELRCSNCTKFKRFFEAFMSFYRVMKRWNSAAVDHEAEFCLNPPIRALSGRHNRHDARFGSSAKVVSIRVAQPSMNLRSLNIVSLRKVFKNCRFRYCMPSLDMRLGLS